MGKYSKTPKKKKTNPSKVLLLIALSFLLVVLIWIAITMDQLNIPEIELTPSSDIENPAGGTAAGNQMHAPTENMDDNYGQLEVVQIGEYAGIFMEDGSDEIVSNVMMIILKNNTLQDLQLARVEIQYTDFTAEFEVTNIPKGESAVALEKKRRELPDEDYKTVAFRNLVYFEEPMSLQEETLQISGGKGYLDITNISDEQVDGTTYVYYKNSASDLLYGGITYRAVIRETIQPGETIRVLTGHYSPENCRILQIVIE